MWVRNRKGALINLDAVRTVDLADPEHPLGSRTFSRWSVIFIGNAGEIGIIEACESREEAVRLRDDIWSALTNGRNLDIRDLGA